MDNIFIPHNAVWRQTSAYPYVFYDEWRSRCPGNVMIYYQRKTVSYADYVVGLWYVSPTDLEGSWQQ